MKLENIHKIRNNILVAILGAFIGGIINNHFVKEFSIGFLDGRDIFPFLFALLAIILLELYRVNKSGG